MFLVSAGTPATAVIMFVTFMYINNVDFGFLMESIIQFSPLTTIDLYSNWGYVVSYYIVHYSIYRSFSGIENKLTEFVHIFVVTMKGIVFRGIYERTMLSTCGR